MLFYIDLNTFLFESLWFQLNHLKIWKIKLNFKKKDGHDDLNSHRKEDKDQNHYPTMAKLRGAKTLDFASCLFKLINNIASIYSFPET